MKLIDKINHLRSAAAFLFDLGRSQGRSMDELSESIKPISGKLSDAISEACLKEKVLAIKFLQHQVEAHGLDMQLIQGKIIDCETHVRSIEQSFIKELSDKNLNILSEDGYTASLVDGKIVTR